MARSWIFSLALQATGWLKEESWLDRQQGKRYFPSLQCPDQLWGTSNNLLFKGYRGEGVSEGKAVWA